MAQTRQPAGDLHPIHTSLPVALTNFVGRQREIADVAQLLASARMVSLIGAGGSGKTRLALQISAAVANLFAGNVCWVELDRLADPALVPQAVAKALNVTEQPGQPLLELLLNKLRDKHALLVLDNCEHLLTACGDLADTLLRHTRITILATSREPLGVAGEAQYLVPPLALPMPRQSAVEAEHHDAVRLFVERARSTRPDFALTNDNAAAVIDICRRLDGMPLAIELASARVNVLSVQQIAERLDRRLDFLVSPARGEARHRTLRAAIDWSYDLLSSTEQVLLQRIALFASDFSLSTAESACGWGEIERDHILTLLASLVDKSLVIADTLQGQHARCRMLETIRQYAQARLRASSAWAEANDHYLASYLSLAEEIAPKLFERDQQIWFKWLESEYDNVRVALSWALEAGRIEAGLRMCTALYQFWITRSYVREGFTWFNRFHERADAARTALPLDGHVKALTYGAFIAMFMGHAPAAVQWSQHAMVMCEAAGEAGAPLLGLALAGASSAATAAGDLQASYAIIERHIALMRESGDALMLGMSVFTQGMTAITLGKYNAARAHLDEAMTLAREAEDPYRVAFVLKAMGDLARCEQDWTRAATLYETSLPLFRDLGATRDIPNDERHLAYACLRQGDLPRAQLLFRRSLEAQRALDNRAGILRGLLGLSAFAACAGLPEMCAQLHGFVHRSRSAIVQTDDSGDRADELDYEHFSMMARARLGDAYEMAEVAGDSLSLDQAIEMALSLSLPESNVTNPEDALDGLTTREREIAGLIGGGLSNGEIAAQLFLSKRTVEKHIANILSKLGLTTRAQVMRWATDHLRINGD